MKHIFISFCIVFFCISCQNDSTTVSENTNQNKDSLNVIENHDTMEVVHDIEVKQEQESSLSLENYYSRFAFNDTLLSNYSNAIDFLDENDLEYDEFYDYDMEENIISISMKDSEGNKVVFLYNYIDDDEGDNLRYAHTFDFMDKTQINSFIDYLKIDLIKRFGEEYIEKNENCQSYLWQYNAEILYNCKTSPKTVTVRK